MGRIVTTENFILKCKLLYGDKYDYSKVIYNGSKNKVVITCKMHGDFEQIPYLHFKQTGCRICGFKLCAEANTLDVNHFINKANLIHNNYYIYTNSIYTNNSTKLEIICLKHGSFMQTPVSHYSGNGCRICNKSKSEKKIKYWLNYYNVEFIEQKWFEDCRNIKVLPFDFYLPEYNLLLEYQGEQHFKEIKFFSNKNLASRQKLDKIKKDYAINNKYNFLEITYKDNIELKLHNYFKFMIKLDTKINHNISDEIFKRVIAETANLIRYGGAQYLDAINKINSQYEFEGVNTLTEREYSEKLNLEREKITEKLGKEYSLAEKAH